MYPFCFYAKFFVFWFSDKVLIKIVNIDSQYRVKINGWSSNLLILKSSSKSKFENSFILMQIFLSSNYILYKFYSLLLFWTRKSSSNPSTTSINFFLIYFETPLISFTARFFLCISIFLFNLLLFFSIFFFINSKLILINLDLNSYEIYLI